MFQSFAIILSMLMLTWQVRPPLQRPEFKKSSLHPAVMTLHPICPDDMCRLAADLRMAQDQVGSVPVLQQQVAQLMQRLEDALARAKRFEDLEQTHASIQASSWQQIRVLHVLCCGLQYTCWHNVKIGSWCHCQQGPVRPDKQAAAAGAADGAGAHLGSGTCVMTWSRCSGPSERELHRWSL